MRIFCTLKIPEPGSTSVFHFLNRKFAWFAAVAPFCTEPPISQKRVVNVFHFEALNQLGHAETDSEEVRYPILIRYYVQSETEYLN